MDKFIGIELDRFGFSVDSYWFYLSISWELLVIAAASVVAYKIYKWWRVF